MTEVIYKNDTRLEINFLAILATYLPMQKVDMYALSYSKNGTTSISI